MLWTALQDPDPVLIFENVMLYNHVGTIASNSGSVEIEKAAIRRAGSDLSFITYGGSLFKTLEAAEALARDGIEAEVIDLRSLRPLDEETILTSVAKTRRAVIVDEGWRSGSLAAASSSNMPARATAPKPPAARLKNSRRVVPTEFIEYAIFSIDEQKLIAC